jgi:hypothetical protein
MIDWDRSATPWWHDLIGPSVSNKLAEMLVHVTCDEEDGFRSIEIASKDSSLANQSGWIDNLDLLCCVSKSSRQVGNDLGLIGK